MKYNWQQEDWPNFQYDFAEIQELLFECTKQISLQAGKLSGFAEEIRLETIIHFMVAEAIKSSAIEGLVINKDDVMSSVRNNMGLNSKPEEVKDLKAIGISKMMVDAYQSYAEPLTIAKLNEWHEILFHHQADFLQIKIGEFRSHQEPMQVVSGAIGKQKIHFEAPPSKQLNKEMKAFVKWFENIAPGKTNEIPAAPLRSAIAHLYFESIHPYEDGNGRIGRAIAEKALSQSIGRPVLLSLSKEIEANKKLYYTSLERAQKSNEITAWLKYFIGVILKSAIQAEEHVNFVVSKSKFFEANKDKMNSRQTKVINRMLAEGEEGFAGGINARKYIGIAKCSKATATRDLSDLLEKNILERRQASGRSTSYDLNL